MSDLSELYNVDEEVANELANASKPQQPAPAATASSQQDSTNDIFAQITELLNSSNDNYISEPPKQQQYQQSIAQPTVAKVEPTIDDIDLFGLGAAEDVSKPPADHGGFQFDLGDSLASSNNDNLIFGGESSSYDTGFGYTQAKNEELGSQMSDQISQLERENARLTLIEQISETREELQELLPSYNPPTFNITTASISDLRGYLSILSRKYESVRFGTIGNQALSTLFSVLEASATAERPLFGLLDLTGLASNGRRVIQRNQSQISRGLSKKMGGYLDHSVLGVGIELGLQIVFTATTNAFKPKNNPSDVELLRQLDELKNI